MIISCDRIFLLLLKYLFLWSWPWNFPLSEKLVFHKHILFTIDDGYLINIIGRLKVGQMNPPFVGSDFLSSAGVFGDMSGANRQSETYGC